MRFPVIILLCLCILFALHEPSQAHENVVDFQSNAAKEGWLISALSSVRKVAAYKDKRPLLANRRTAGIRSLNSDVQFLHQNADEKIKLSQPMSSFVKAVLSHKSKLHRSPSSYGAANQLTRLGSIKKFASMISARQVPEPSPPSSQEMGIHSTAQSNVARQRAGESASPTPIPSVLFEEVMLCKARNPVWNVAIRNKMGDLLILAYPGSESKAETFAQCIRDDVTSMKREEYLRFAMYNCVGTEACAVNQNTGVCSCTRGPERCINVDYTRALIECKYGPGVGV